MASIEKSELRIAVAHELGESLRAKHDQAQVQEHRAAGAEVAAKAVADNIGQLTRLLAEEVEKGLAKGLDVDGVISLVTRYIARAQGIANSQSATEAARKLMAAGMVAGLREALKGPVAAIAAEQRKIDSLKAKAAAGLRSFSADVDEGREQPKPEAVPEPEPEPMAAAAPKKTTKRKSRKKAPTKSPPTVSNGLSHS